jgi:hypothetical protein
VESRQKIVSRDQIKGTLYGKVHFNGFHSRAWACGDGSFKERDYRNGEVGSSGAAPSDFLCKAQPFAHALRVRNSHVFRKPQEDERRRGERGRSGFKDADILNIVQSPVANATEFVDQVGHRDSKTAADGIQVFR